jgi:hypothetical protein
LGRFKIHFIEMEIQEFSVTKGYLEGKCYARTFGAIALLPQMALRSSDNRCCNRPYHFFDWVVHGQTTSSKEHKADVVLNW